MNVLGVDIGGTGIKGAPVNIETGELLEDRFRIPTPKPATPEAVVDTVSDLIKHFNWNGPVGCGFPAAIVNDTVMTAANIDDSWIGKNAGKILKIIDSKSEVDIITISKYTKMKIEEIYLAIGWLSRENKIKFSYKNSKILYELT